MVTRKETPMETTITKRYSLPDGRILWVGRGLGQSFMTFDSDPRAPGKHRFTSKNLPPRKSIDEAQRDLDQYATKGKLPEARP
jgi:hypothetical protein